MPLPLLSELQIIHDPAGGATTLLEYDDWLTRFPSFNGSQIVQVQDFVRAAAAKTFSRGNDTHTFAFTMRLIPAAVKTLYEGMFIHSGAMPRDSKTVRFSVRDGLEYDLSDATVQAFGAGIFENALDLTVVIIGGALAQVP